MKRIRIVSVAVFVLTGLLFSGCVSHNEKTAPQAIKVAITKIKPDKYGHTYRQWLQRYDKNVQWINLYPLSVDSALKVLKTCDGLLCTGGGDFDPSLYGKGDQASKCGPPDPHRDSLEIEAIHEAVKMKMPLFGVCRGLQGINIALGGTLYTDLPTDIGTKVMHRSKAGKPVWHEVYIHKSSEVYAISKVDSGLVYSHHHQGIDKLGNNLRVGARTADSLPEEIEWTDTAGKGFLMAVQFHPEHGKTSDPLSKSFAVKFLNEMNIYKTQKERKK